MFDLDSCLQRIGYEGGREADLQTLKALQRAFVYHVPFENLDIHLGREIVLDVERFYHKIVGNQRGGFCYECNTLFHGMLSALGYRVHFIAATMQLEIAMNIEFEHMALLVELGDRQYLVDVGNGQSCLQPMDINSDEVARFENIDYQVGQFEDRQALYFRREGEDWLPRFSFTTTPRQLHQYEDICHTIQISPDSHFTQRKVVTLARTDGRITLVDRDLEIWRGKQVKKRLLETNQEYCSTLKNAFGIQLAPMPENW